jgi:hypothetical protein
MPRSTFIAVPTPTNTIRYGCPCLREWPTMPARALPTRMRPASGLDTILGGGGLLGAIDDAVGAGDTAPGGLLTSRSNLPRSASPAVSGAPGRRRQPRATAATCTNGLSRIEALREVLSGDPKMRREEMPTGATDPSRRCPQPSLVKAAAPAESTCIAQNRRFAHAYDRTNNDLHLLRSGKLPLVMKAGAAGGLGVA